MQYDLAEKKITRTIPWPKGEEREGVGVMFSPDGKLLYLFGEDVLIYETETFTEVDTLGSVAADRAGRGARRASAGSTPSATSPGFFTGLFTMQDPLQNRRIMGIGRIELAKKKIDFHPIGPARGIGFAVAPDRKRGYGLLATIEEYELWTFDLRELPRALADTVPRPATNGPARQQQRQRDLHPHRRQHDRSVRGRDVQAPADDHARRRHDRLPAPAAEATRIAPGAEDAAVDRRAFRYIRPVLAPTGRDRRHQPDQHDRSRSLCRTSPRSWSTMPSWRATRTRSGRRSGCLLAAGALGFVLSVVSGLRYTRVSAEILFDMRRDLYEHLQRLSPRFYAATRFGDIVSRINNDIGEIQRVVAETALAWFGNVLFLVGSVGMLLWLDWRLCLVGMASLPPAAWALVRYRRQIEVRTMDLRERSADIGTFLIETLQGMRTVVTSGAERREVARFTRLNDAFIATLMGVQRSHYVAGGVPSLVIGAGTLGVFFYGGWRVVEGTLTLGTLAAFLAYHARVVAPVQALMGLYGALATARVSWRRVAALLDAAPEVVERQDAVPAGRCSRQDRVRRGHARARTRRGPRRRDVPRRGGLHARRRRGERQRQVDHRRSRGAADRSRCRRGAARWP